MAITQLPLRHAEHHMLQVLLPTFTLDKLDDADGGRLGGVGLTAEFTDEIGTMWRRQQRKRVQRSIPKFDARAEKIDKALADFLADPNALSWTFSQPPFVFRYGNGGALPILRMGDREYYCLAYRDIAPIGWNLANGGSDSRDELLNPLITLERELREEILIVNEERRIRYALQWEDEDALDRPEFRLAREFWKRKRGLDIGTFEERKAPVTWIHGPDRITIKAPGQFPCTTTGLFLNISAADFGIEVDRVARIHVDDGAIVLDGEISGSKLVNRPIGLFEVDRFAKAFLRGETEFVPDILFLSGERVVGSNNIVARHEEACSNRNRPLRSPKENKAWDKCRKRYSLCPVARQLMARHLAQDQAGLARAEQFANRQEPRRCKVFISSTGHASDLAIARAIHANLAKKRVGPVFFYEDGPQAHTNSNWMRKIEDALLSASDLIVVCTDIARVRRLDFEWQSFYIWVRYGRKKTGRIVPVLHNVRLHNLPLPLGIMDPVVWPDQAALLGLLKGKAKDRLPRADRPRKRRKASSAR